MEIDKERMKEVTKNLGLEIEIGSDRPGITNIETGEYKTWEDIRKDMWEFLGLEDTVND